MLSPARAVLALSAALALSACDKPQDAAFGERVRAYLLEHPEVLEEVAMKLNEKKQAEAIKASTAAIDKHRAALERDPRDFVANPNGKYTVVEFYDYRCSYCKVVAPEVTKLIRENPDVRFVFKELPIFGEVSDSAARLALTQPVKARGLDVYGRWMADKALTEAAPGPPPARGRDRPGPGPPGGPGAGHRPPHLRHPGARPGPEHRGHAGLRGRRRHDPGRRRQRPARRHPAGEGQGPEAHQLAPRGSA